MFHPLRNGRENMGLIEKYPATTKNPVGFSRTKLEGVDDYLSYSRFKLLRQSAAHYEWIYVLGNEPKKTQALSLGDLIHMAILDASEFRRRFHVMPEFKGTGSVKARNEWKDSIPEDAIIIKDADQEKVTTIINKVLKHPKASQLFAAGTSEVFAYYWDEQFKCRICVVIDWLRDDLWIAELKTATDALFWQFQKDCDKFAYHFQTELYMRALKAIAGKEPWFTTVVVQTSPPYGVKLYAPCGRFREAANWEMTRLAHLWHRCKKTKHWPFGDEAIEVLDLPNFAHWRIEELANKEMENAGES